ncbi:hypothetical protein VOLCADRAFT_65341 [Volvox carteri f. nagariensis]|uniref:Uncharacterized protein n=1 Tax=Volvox carteri f. nagariensis TaxID=3068 RepID=D8U8D3_VOLCA|nr:uncharacterized protein VOLCADRAFT_65341 [Volvox carteri f. nagariensis]EFJ44118.1 hypothetical protein VOLCADRAFT_65341 [Volvox carteri f. nagariensis]|eukprot:XP_002954919.1 hypothetical protein VOLCADRAFT_65341 [Volvox carteri f. nagariensis]
MLIQRVQVSSHATRGVFRSPPLTSRSAAVAVHATTNRSVFITGGNTGIGYETAKTLAAQGFCVTIGCRDPAKAAAALTRIKEAVPSAAVDSVALDLSDLNSVSDCAKRVLDSGIQYDVWINNAGVMACPKMTTSQGFEYQLGVNHLGHFALTNQVLPALKAADKPVRIINVASAAHLFGKIDFEDLMRDRSYDAWEAYGQSKLANIMFSYELNRRLGADSKITVNCLHPGVVKTELGRCVYMYTWYMPLAIEVMKFFMLEPAQGAATSIHLASSPEVEGVTGKYYVDCRRAVSSNDSYNRDTASRLWEVSQELTGAVVPVAEAVAA